MSSYPFKKSILGMIPEEVTVDEDYIKQLAISKGIDIQTICNLWYETMKIEKGVIEIGSSKEALQRTIDERDETIESLEERLRTAILERDHYRKELSSPSKEIDLLNSQLEKSKASYVDLRDKYDNLCKEKREYDSLAQELEEGEKANRDLANENNKLREANTTYKEDLEIIGGYYKDLQLDRNNICKELFRLRPELENTKDTICKLREDIEEQYKKIKYMEDNYISKQVAQEERKYAEIEIHNRINDTKDLIRAIHTISKFI